MPANKDAFLRYRIINNAIRNRFKPYPSLEEIKEKIFEVIGKEVGDRTVLEDVRRMKEDSALGFNAPIKYSKKEKGYYYEDENYSIDNFPLKEEDLSSIRFASAMLGQFKNIPILEQFSGAVEKIENAFKLVKRESEDSASNKLLFEKAPKAVGAEHLKALLEAIERQVIVKVEYEPFNKPQSKDYFISPYLLKEYRHRWYLVGYDNEKNRIISLGLDRIVVVDTTDELFLYKEGFSPSDYFKYTFGITWTGKPAEEIILAFTERQVPYLQTSPLHHSQKYIGEKGERFLFSLEVGISYELESMILSYGNDVKVVAPESLKETIRKSLKSNLENYH